MKKKLRCLVTGGTGFLGSYVVEELKKIAHVDVISRSGKTGIQGDLSKWGGGVDIEKLQGQSYDLFLHMAALYDLKASESDVYMNNVVGTNMALQIAKALRIPVFINISSIAAASNLIQESVAPDELNFSKPFHDFYSESKALVEQLVKNWPAPIRFKLNLRLGILVGDTQKGQIQRLDGPYFLASSIHKFKSYLEKWNYPLPLPGNKEVRLPLVPVDEAARAVVRLCEWSTSEENIGYESLHLAPYRGLPIMDLYKSVFKHFGLPEYDIHLVNHIPASVVSKIGGWALDIPEESVRYALQLPHFDTLKTEDILGSSWCSEFHQYENIFWSGYEKYISNC